METKESDYIVLLKKKLNVLNEMLVLTKGMDFFDESVSMNVHAENYSALYEKRALLLKQAAQFDEQLNSPDYEFVAQSKDGRFIESYELLTSKTKDVIRNILELDEKNKTAAERFMAFVKNNIRDIKIGRNVNTMYQTEVVADGGIYFDKKN